MGLMEKLFLEKFKGSLDDLLEEYSNDREMMLELCKANPIYFKYISEEMRDDEEIAYETAIRDHFWFQFASERIRDNKEYMMKLCKKEPLVFSYASDRLKDDKEFVLEVCSRNTSLVENASERFRADIDVVEAVLNGTKNWYRVHTLSYFSEEIQDNEFYVKRFMKLDKENILYASKRLKNDKLFAKWAIEHGVGLFYLGEEIRKDKDLVLMAVDHDGEDLEYASFELKKDPLVAYTALNGTCPYLEYWQADDWYGEYPHDVFQYIEKGLLKSYDFSLNIAKAFLLTEPGKDYSLEDFMKQPQKVYEIYDKICAELSSPKYPLDLSGIIGDLKQ